MFYVYGASKSRATNVAENLLNVCEKKYKLFILGKDYTVQQLHKLVPNTTCVPHIYDGTKYVGEVKDLYDYLYVMVKFKEDDEQ